MGAVLPSLFAVWRPCLNRWQLVEPVRGARGQVTRLRAAYGPWVRASIHTTDARLGADAERCSGTVSIGGKPCSVRWVNQHVSLWFLDGRDCVMQRIPVVRVDGRRLPRGVV